MAYNFLDDLKKAGFYEIFGNPQFYAACNGNGCKCNNENKEAPEPDDFYADGADWRAQVRDGRFVLQAIATGCGKDDYTVKVNKDKGVLIVKFKNENDELENDDLWFISDIDIHVRLPKHIDYKSFHKEVEDGLLIVTADIVKSAEKTDDEITVE